MTPLWKEALELRAATPDPTERGEFWIDPIAHQAIAEHDNETDFIHFLTANNAFNVPHLTGDPLQKQVNDAWLAAMPAFWTYPRVEESPFCDPRAMYELDGRRVSNLLMMQMYYAQRIDSVGPETILEIGAGYGGLARVLQARQARKYVIVDLVDSLFCSYVYLKANCPSATFSWGTLTAADFNFIPAHKAADLMGCRFDIAVNTCSLGEMTPIQRAEYIFQIGTTCKYFYSHNRIEPPITIPALWTPVFIETEGAAQAEPMTPPSIESLWRI